MAVLSLKTTPEQDYGPVVDHSATFDGWTGSVATFRQTVDHAPILRGLPDDRCQCPHLGYVIKGRMSVNYADGRTEVAEAGDAFYLPPGHIPNIVEGSTVLMWSPADELAATEEAIKRNLPALQGS